MTTEGKEVVRAKFEYEWERYIYSRANHVSPILIVGTSTNTPPSGEESQMRKEKRRRKRKKKKRKRKNNSKGKRKRKKINQTKMITMTMKESRREWFGEDISSHIIHRDPDSRERTVVDVFANEVMADIDMFRPGGDGISHGVGNGTVR